MARRKGFVASMVQVQRELEKAQRAQQAAHDRARRQAEQARRAAERAAAADERDRKRLHIEAREAEVALQNVDLDGRLEDLQAILAETLQVDDFLDFESLKERLNPAPFAPGELADAEPPPRRPPNPPEPSGLAKLSRRAKDEWTAQVAAMDAAHKAALDRHSLREAMRESRLVKARDDYSRQLEDERRRIERQHAAVDEFKAEFEGGNVDAIKEYYSLVLERSAYPDGFPQRARVAFVPESRQLAVEYELPPFEVVPDVKEYRYVKVRDEITSTALPESQRRALFASVVAQVTLRTLHELFEADRGRYIDTVTLNGHVDTVDPGTGQAIRPCLVTVRTTRDAFAGLDLSRVDPVSCLKVLNASLSKSPAELVAVRPVLDFNMFDPRFVEEVDVLSGLDQRPNLMELTPNEFESLITNLFEKMGLETRLTQASRDGGVDCVAYDNRPIFGGKVIIQAKRYKNTVGVSAVRDLFGTVHNEGASKGILVTTSGFGKAAFDFSSGKPLELLSGSNLLALLAEHAGIEARIVPPDDWADPQVDA